MATWGNVADGCIEIGAVSDGGMLLSGGRGAGFDKNKLLRSWLKQLMRSWSQGRIDRLLPEEEEEEE